MVQNRLSQNRMSMGNYTIDCDNATDTNIFSCQYSGNISVDDVTEHAVSVWIFTYISPFLIIIGSLGNILSIIVLSRKNMRRSNTSIYLIILAITDIAVLNVGLLNYWIIAMYDVDIADISDIGCKLKIFLVYFTTDFSAWMLVFITCERTTAIWFPHSKKCSRSMGLISIVTMGFCLFGINSHFFYGISNYSTFGACDSIDEDYHHFARKVWPWIDLIVFSVGPLTLLAIGNSLIVYKVLESKKIVRKTTGPTSTTNPGHRKSSSMTIMLIVVNIVFVVCTLPICVFQLIVPYIDISEAQYDIVHACVVVFQYLNFSVNFFLYCFGGSRFREELVSIFGRHKRVHPLTTTTGRMQAASVPPKP